MQPNERKEVQWTSELPNGMLWKEWQREKHRVARDLVQRGRAAMREVRSTGVQKTQRSSKSCVKYLKPH